MANKSTKLKEGNQMMDNKIEESEMMKTTIYMPIELWKSYKTMTMNRADGAIVTLNSVLLDALRAYAQTSNSIDTGVKRIYDFDVPRRYETWISELLTILQGKNKNAISFIQDALHVTLRLMAFEGKKHEIVKDDVTAPANRTKRPNVGEHARRPPSGRKMA